jgi:hypothetical protein
MNPTELINKFIAEEGKGSVRDALNVALARLDMLSENGMLKKRIQEARRLLNREAEGYAVYGSNPPEDLLSWLEVTE